MTPKEIEIMPKALRILADQITAPDDIPAMCLRDAAAMIESLATQLAEARDQLEKRDETPKNQI